MLTYKKSKPVFFLVFAIAAIALIFNSFFFLVLAVAFLSWLSLLVWGASSIESQFFVQALCSNPSEKKKNVAITFDDGPHPATKQILEVLKKHRAQATFFCIGKNVEAHPEIVKKLMEEGHTIGNHSFSHPNTFGFYSKKKIQEELEKTNQCIEKATQKRTRMFRPPFGVTNPNIAKVVATSGHNVIGWNIRSLDTVIADEDEILKRIKKRLHPGSIILLHDTSDKTVRVLEQLLVYLQEQKYKVVPLPTLLNIAAYEN